MNAFSEILNLRLLSLGRAVVTPLSLGTAAIIIVFSFGAARILGRVLSRMRERSKHGSAPLYIVQKVSTYSLTLFGVFIAMSVLGLNLSSLASGPDCPFHQWPKARAEGVGASGGVFEKSVTTFTTSGDAVHCAHDWLRGMREPRCKVDVLETHLCCRACIYAQICWATDADRLPCPEEDSAFPAVTGSPASSA